jgi:predicted alpha-1,2-mannosidase
MTKDKLYLSFVLTALFFMTGCHKKAENLIQYVNPLIGTGPSTSPNVINHYPRPEVWGQDIPAVSTPLGMTQWTPQTRDAEDKGVSPYYYGGISILGFRGTHWQGGLFTQDYGSFTIMPMTGYLRTFGTDRASVYTHENEVTTPAYYSYMLLSYLTLVEITGTARSGFFKFSYAKKDKGFILITPNSDAGKGYIKIDPEKQEIYGYNPVEGIFRSPGKSAGFSGYFVMRFKRPMDNYGCYFQMEDLKKQTEISGKPNIGAYAEFNIKEGDLILAKVGTSFTSIESARANLDAEIPHWDFQKTKAEAEQIWNDALSAVHLEGGKKEDYTKFYTAMYHSLLYPRTFSDVDGSYPDFTGKTKMNKMDKGHIYYDDFSLNDSHKLQLSLIRLIAPDKYEDMQESVALKVRQGGWMPDSIVCNRHFPYLYDYLSDPEETQNRVKSNLATEYTCYDGGIPGNDDSGQTSAWYVFSAMGFYPVSPGSSEYQLSSPIFNKVELNLNPKYYPGKRFKISVDDQNTYKAFNQAELNGQKIPFILKHEDISKGGRLKFSNSEK